MSANAVPSARERSTSATSGLSMLAWRSAADLQVGLRTDHLTDTEADDRMIVHDQYPQGTLGSQCHSLPACVVDSRRTGARAARWAGTERSVHDTTVPPCEPGSTSRMPPIECAR